MALKIMILGANGFIGSALTNAILRTRPWEVYGIDLADNKLGDLPKTERFHFVEDRKSTRLNSSHLVISYAVFCLKKTKNVLGIVDEASHIIDMRIKGH